MAAFHRHGRARRSADRGIQTDHALRLTPDHLTGAGQIAAYVLRRAGDRLTFQLPVEKRQLASYLGMTPENLSRAMRSLADDGMKVDGQRIIITDRPALEAVALVTPLLDGQFPPKNVSSC